MADIQIRRYDHADDFTSIYRHLRGYLLSMSSEVDVGEWHAIDVSGKKELVSHELEGVSFHCRIPETPKKAQSNVKPNLPWAEKQFLERVSGQPLNPGETYKEWPWQSQMGKHVSTVFSHTYMERYWPKHAWGSGGQAGRKPNRGIRYDYGDLRDVVDLLARSPFTRQAVLPVWFPEDTGAVHGGRVPCSLTYQFLLRDGRLHCSYSIRSCDFVRHFRDDVYMTMRLVQWVIKQVANKNINEGAHQVWDRVKPGVLTMHIGSLHYFTGDEKKLRAEVDKLVRQRVKTE